MPACCSTPDSCYRALATRDPRFDGRFFVGVSLDRHLLPAGVHGAHAAARELPLLPERGGGRARRVSARACAAGRSSRPATRASTPTARLAQAAASLIEDGRRCEDGGLDAISPRARRHRPPPAPRVPAGVRRVARRVRADAAAAARQAPADRHGPARHRRRLRQRLREPAPLQRAVPQRYRMHARPAAPHTVARRATAEPPRRSSCAYRPPLDWAALLAFLGARAIAGVEIGQTAAHIAARRAHRASWQAATAGWIEVRQSTRRKPALRDPVWRLAR